MTNFIHTGDRSVYVDSTQLKQTGPALLPLITTLICFLLGLKTIYIAILTVGVAIPVGLYSRRLFESEESSYTMREPDVTFWILQEAPNVVVTKARNEIARVMGYKKITRRPQRELVYSLQTGISNSLLTMGIADNMYGTFIVVRLLDRSHQNDPHLIEDAKKHFQIFFDMISQKIPGLVLEDPTQDELRALTGIPNLSIPKDDSPTISQEKTSISPINSRNEIISKNKPVKTPSLDTFVKKMTPVTVLEESRSTIETDLVRESPLDQFISMMDSSTINTNESLTLEEDNLPCRFVLDGSNVAKHNMNVTGIACLENLIIVRKKFLKLGQVKIIAKKNLRQYIDRPEEFDAMVEKREINEAPYSRDEKEGELDDETIVRYAYENDYYVISNDLYKKEDINSDFLRDETTQAWLRTHRIPYFIYEKECIFYDLQIQEPGLLTDFNKLITYEKDTRKEKIAVIDAYDVIRNNSGYNISQLTKLQKDLEERERMQTIVIMNPKLRYKKDLKEEYERMKVDGLFYERPAGTMGEFFVIRLAQQLGGWVVSNSQFSSFWKELEEDFGDLKVSLKNWLEKRQVRYQIIGDQITYIPTDFNPFFNVKRKEKGKTKVKKRCTTL